MCSIEHMNITCMIIGAGARGTRGVTPPVFIAKYEKIKKVIPF